MSAELDFSCIEKLQDKLKDMGKKGTTLENKALLAGAEIINKEIVKNAPVRRKGSRNSKEKLKLSKVKKEKGIKVVKIGVQKDDNSEAFYLKFYEYGTSKQVARPFMRPAFERKKKEAFEKTKDVIREGVGL